MPRLGDVPKLFRSVGPWEFSLRVWKQINDDNLLMWAAALAYSWLFAIFPFLLFLLSLLPYLPANMHKSAERAIMRYVYQTLPPQSAKMVGDVIEGNASNLLRQSRGLILYTALIVALWAASGGMAATMSALDRCYELDRGRPFYKHRLIAILMTIIVSAMLLAVALLLPVGGMFRRLLVSSGIFGANHPLLIVFDSIRWVLAVLFMFALLALVYYKGPSIKHHFYWVTPGAVFCVVVWIALGLAFRFYVEKFGGKGYDRMYGAVGGVAIMLLLFYLDALVLLVGAEINSEIDFEVLKVRRGTRDLRRAEEFDALPTAL